MLACVRACVLAPGLPNRTAPSLSLSQAMHLVSLTASQHEFTHIVRLSSTTAQAQAQPPGHGKAGAGLVGLHAHMQRRSFWKRLFHSLDSPRAHLDTSNFRTPIAMATFASAMAGKQLGACKPAGAMRARAVVQGACAPAPRAVDARRSALITPTCPAGARPAQRGSRRAVVVQANLFSRFARVIKSYANTIGALPPCACASPAPSLDAARSRPPRSLLLPRQ